MEEKCVKMQNPAHFWAKTRRVYRYRLSCTDIRMQRAIGTSTTQTCTGTDWQWITCTGTGQSGTGTGTGCSSSPVLTSFRTVKSRIRIRCLGTLRNE